MGKTTPYLERQIKVFVVISLIFTVIIYFVYSISLPTIVSLLVMCSFLFYVKRIIMFNRNYGRYAFVLGVVLIAANVLSESINFVIGLQGFANI
jgi:uncharacterized membrane protein